MYRSGHICVIYAALARAWQAAGAVVKAPLSNNAKVAGRLVSCAGRQVFRDWCMPHDLTLEFIVREDGE